ncbi:MAG: transcriptional regulator [Syntrophomonadaceae bacterium]|nr:transcriptional regulator [Syntrophomonadaceae bacterium]
MDIIRIQDKIISRKKIYDSIAKILQLRGLGYSQQEVADKMSVDRTFISRLEGIGELRKGKTIACIGFPIENKTEIQAIMEKEGVDFIMLMTEEERLDYVEQRSGKEMLNELMDLIGQMQTFNTVIAIGSDNRIKLIQGLLLDSEVISLEIGTSPITDNRWVDPEEISQVLAVIRTAR